MNRKTIFLPSVFLVLSFILSACMGLIPLEEKPVAGDYGPAYSSQEHQARTFEALWKNFQDSYIYYDSADVDWQALNKKYTERINAGLSDEQFNALLHDLESDLPSGSLTYQSRTERIDAETTDLSTYDGIGAFIGFRADPVPHIILLSVIQGSPAEAAGLRAHDSILEIDGSPIQSDEGLNAVDRIRGPAGSSVTLNVQSPGKETRSIELQRAKLTSTGKLESSIIPETNYGYVLFPPIGYTSMVDDVLKSLQELTTNRKLEGLILDLRIAGSSRGWPLQELSTLFQDGKVGEFYNRTKQEQALTVTGQDKFSSQSVPLVVIVGQNTTGFPEILAAGLQAAGRAVVVGSTTPGSIETTTSFYLPNGSIIFVESTSFKLPNGEEIGNSGVKPDVQVEAGWDEVLPTADPVLESAIKSLGAQQ